MGLLNVERAFRLMADEDTAVLIGTSKEHVRYLSDFECPGQVLMPSVSCAAVLGRESDLVSLVVPRSELDAVAELGTSAHRVVSYGEFFVEYGDMSGVSAAVEQRLMELRAAEVYPSFAAAVAGEAARLGSAHGKVALDTAGLLPSVADAVRGTLDGCMVGDGYGLLQRIRQVKTAAEVERLRMAINVTEHALAACVAAFDEGVTELQLREVYDCEVRARGAETTFAMIGIGAHGALSNACPSSARLNHGDVVRFDIGCRYRGYHSDIARIAHYGELDSEWERIYNALVEGEEAAECLMRCGVPAATLFEAAVSQVRLTVPNYERHHVGHGIGAELYDPPVVTRSSGGDLEEGMVMNLETPYYRLGAVGLQVEDTYLVTRDGCERLTSMDKRPITK